MNKLKKYLSKKPKGEFWMWAFIYLLIFHITPFALIHVMIPLGLGLADPNANFSEAYEVVSMVLVDVKINVMQTVTETGQDIALNSPITAKVILFIITSQVLIGYIFLAWIILHGLRMIIYFSGMAHPGIPDM